MRDSRPTVSQVTWNWRAEAGSPSAAGTDLRRAAVVQAVVMGLVAAFVLYGLHHALAGRIIAGAAFLVLLTGLFVAPAYRQLHRFGQGLGRVVGGILVYVLLVPFFYLAIVPGALWLRLRGRDPLHRQFRDPRYSYWIARRPQAPDQNIGRQFLQEDRAARGALRDVGPVPERDPEAGP